MCKWMTEGDVEGFKKRAIVNYQYMKAMTLMSVSVCVSVWGGEIHQRLDIWPFS